MVTSSQVRSVIAKLDADLNDRDVEELKDQCNEQDGISGRTSVDWLYFLAKQIADEQNADALASRHDHIAMYGDD